jgi:oxalate decarboxylase/phosphoglucose isomerase-like protein (cupin superfamily)
MTARTAPQSAIIDRAAIPTHSFDWGAIKWLVTPSTTPGAQLTFGEVSVMPGKGHSRHNHSDAEEILYILSGEGEQMVADEAPLPIRAGDVLYIPPGVYHATLNTGWEPLRLIALYNPGGSELALMELEDFRETPARESLGWQRE